MNENWPYIKKNIKRFPEYKSSIFEAGFPDYESESHIGGAFPFFGNWRKESLSDSFHIGFTVGKAIHHRKEWDYVLSDWPRYDPFSNQANEMDILRTLAEQSQGSFELGLQTINNLTGLFVLGMIAGERMTFAETLRACVPLTMKH